MITVVESEITPYLLHTALHLPSSIFGECPNSECVIPFMLHLVP